MIKSPLKQFEIDIQGLSDTQHSFEYSFNEKFFEAFENSLVEKGQGSVHLDLLKTETMMTLDFSIKGTVELTCDRSLQLFDYPVDIKETLIVKFGDEDAELDDEIIVIQRDTQKFNVAQFIYEYISVAIPMKKLHPDFRTEEDESEQEYGSIIYQSPEVDQPEKSNDEVDPRWEALKKLRNN